MKEIIILFNLQIPHVLKRNNPNKKFSPYVYDVVNLMNGGASGGSVEPVWTFNEGVRFRSSAGSCGGTVGSHPTSPILSLR